MSRTCVSSVTSQTSLQEMYGKLYKLHNSPTIIMAPAEALLVLAFDKLHNNINLYYTVFLPEVIGDRQVNMNVL